MLEKFAKSNNLFSSLSEKNVEKLVSMLSYTSVSKIERYMACKYAYFIDYILRIENEKEDFVDALDIGNITHNVLESLCREFGQTREGFVNTPDELVYNRISQLINNYIDDLLKHKAEISNRDRYTLNRLSGSIYLCFEAIKNQFANSSFEPLGYEIEFNPDSDLGAIEINTSEGRTIELTGKIDRADIYTSDGVSYVRVVDYKTGGKDFRLGDVFSGLNMQMLIYLMCLWDNGKEKYGDTVPAGIMYVPANNSGEQLSRRAGAEEIEAQKLKNGRMNGMILEEEKILDAMEEGCEGRFINAFIDKKGELQGTLLSLEGFRLLHERIDSMLIEMGLALHGGEIAAVPVMGTTCYNNTCTYCDYKDVCRREAADKVKPLESIKHPDAVRMLKGSESNG